MTTMACCQVGPPQQPWARGSPGARILADLQPPSFCNRWCCTLFVFFRGRKHEKSTAPAVAESQTGSSARILAWPGPGSSQDSCVARAGAPRPCRMSRSRHPPRIKPSLFLERTARSGIRFPPEMAPPDVLRHRRRESLLANIGWPSSPTQCVRVARPWPSAEMQFEVQP